MSYARRVSRQDTLALAGLLLLGVGLPILVGAIASTLDVPRNDDWAYRRIAVDLARTGVLVLNVRTVIIGQILLTQPFLWLSGSQDWGFAVVGVLFAASCVVSAYALARQFLAPSRAALPVLLLLAFPGGLAFATSYMSDVPALAAQFGCLALGIAALRQKPVRGRWLAASIAVGCLGMSMRDFALAAPAAVVLGAICVDMRRWRHWALAGVVVGWYGALYLFRVLFAVTGGAADLFTGGLYQSMQALAIVSLVLAPVALASAIRWRRHWHRVDLLIGMEVGVVLTGARLYPLLRGGTMSEAILPNLVSQWGSPLREMFLGDRPLLIEDGPWALLNLLALGASILVLAVGAAVAGVYIRRAARSPADVVRRVGTPVGILIVFFLAVVIGLGVYGLGTQLFDRYYWPVVPVLAILLLRVPGDIERTELPRRRLEKLLTLHAGVLAVLLAGLALAFQLNANAFDGARWRAGETLVQAGVRADEVDAGYEWVGYYATVPATGGGTSAVRYRRIFADFHQCGWVTSSAVVDGSAELVATQEYALFLVAGPAEPLYLYRSTDPACLAR